MGRKTILVTGGSGFIGSHLCEKLINSGYSVICIDNLITGNKKNIKNLLSNNRFRFFEFDVISPLKYKFGHFDALFHLASPASPNPNSKMSYLHHPIETLLVNTIGTKNMIELALSYKAKFLFASTSEVYGDPQVHPQSESYFGNVDPISTRACYDEGKRCGETIVSVYWNKYNLDGKIVRIFNTYGPRMDPKDGRAVINFIISALKNKELEIYGSGYQTRSFCYVSDMVDGLIKTMFNKNSNKNIINLGNNDEISILELAKKIIFLTNSKSQIKFLPALESDPQKRRPDISKAKKMLNWKPKVSLDDGIKKTIEFFN